MKLKTLATLTTAAALLSVLAGCAANGDTSGGEDSPTLDLPADTAVVRVEQTGGFVTPQTTFSRTPDLAVYADGRAITPGAQILIYPPPALPSLQIAQLSEAQVERIVDLADDAGLLTDDVDYGEPGIADATTTVVTIVTGDGTFVHEAYALTGAGSDLGEGDLPGIDDAAAEARTTLSTFINDATMVAVGGTAGESSAATLWEPEAYSLQATPAQEASANEGDGTEGDATEATDGSGTADGTGLSEGELFGPALPWELTNVDLSAASKCVAVEGGDANALREQLAAANSLTQFEQAGTKYEIAIRPVFPGETACSTGQ